jgi:uncharacterized phage-associated protein
MASALEVAQAFLNLARNEDRTLTNMQLQKLVFIAHGVHLGAFEGEPLIEDEVRAWDFGPVIPVLYEELRRYGRGQIADDLTPPGHRLPFGPDGTEMDAIRTTWETYRDKGAWELSRISHLEGSPWDRVWRRRKYAPIPNDVIRDYYQRHLDVTNAD